MPEGVKEIMTYDTAYYLDVAGKNATTPDIQLMNVGVSKLDEAVNPTEKSTQYIGDKSKTNKVTGYDNQFEFEQDHIKNDKVLDYLYNIFYERKVGADAQTTLYIVDLWNDNKARKIDVSVVFDTKTNTPGEVETLSGTFKGCGDFIYGTFDTAGKKFTETTEAQG